MRCFKSPVVRFGEEFAHVVLPTKLRMQVLQLAHCGLFSGHQGVTKTLDRVTSSFHWPGVHGDVTTFVDHAMFAKRQCQKEKLLRFHLKKCQSLMFHLKV